MSKIDPRIQAVINKQQNFIIPNLLLSSCISFGISYALSSEFTFWGVIGALALIGLIRFFIQEIHTIYLTKKYYNGDIGQMLNDARDAVKFMDEEQSEAPTAPTQSDDGPLEMQIEIMAYPDKIYGRFMDAEFYEWLDVKGSDGKPVRFVFKTTEDLSKGRMPVMQPGCILIPPGLVYEIQQFTPTSN